MMECAKAGVSCTIKTKDGQKFYGENYCLVPQIECPRLPGEGFEKCKSICFQVGHAEEIALMHALHSEADLTDAEVTIDHHRICDNCKTLLSFHGLTEYTFTRSRSDRRNFRSL